MILQVLIVILFSNMLLNIIAIIAGWRRRAGRGRGRRGRPGGGCGRGGCNIIYVIREFRDVVFEDVVFDNNSFVTPYQVESKYRIR